MTSEAATCSAPASCPANSEEAENFEEVIVVTFPADTEAVEGDALFAIGFDLLFERCGFDIAEVGCAIGHEDDAVHAVSDVMAQSGLVSEIHGFFEIGATLRGEAGDFIYGLRGLVAGNAIYAEMGSACKSDDAELVLRI